MFDVDDHTHLAPINAGRLSGLPGEQWQADAEALVLDGHRIGVKDLFHPERFRTAPLAACPPWRLSVASSRGERSN